MLSLCHYVSPATYDLLFKCVPLMGAAQLSFDRVGPERLDALSRKTKSAGLRVRSSKVPRLAFNYAAEYAGWLLWAAGYIYDHTLAYIFPSQRTSPVTFKDGLSGATARGELPGPAAGSPPAGFVSSTKYRPFLKQEDAAPFKAPTFSARKHALLAALTLVLAAAFVITIRGVYSSGDAGAPGAGLHWYSSSESAAQTLFAGVESVVLMLIASSAAMLIVGVLLYALLSAALHLLAEALAWAAWFLSTNRRRDVVFILGVFQLVVPIIVPDKLICGP